MGSDYAGQNALAELERSASIGISNAGQQVTMRQHHPLGLAGAPGGMHEHGRALGLRAGDQLVSEIGVADD